MLKETDDIVQSLIELLQESDLNAQELIKLMVVHIDSQKLGNIIVEAARLYKAGNEYVIDPVSREKRLRTLGGCFFKIARRRLTKGQKRQLK